MGPGDQSELNAAKQRLNQALSRLESGLKNTREKAGRAETLEEERAGIAGELEVLRSARDRLAKKLATVERTYAAREKSTDTVSARLDSTIDQLKSVLDS